jgi:hypothetical protein
MRSAKISAREALARRSRGSMVVERGKVDKMA